MGGDQRTFLCAGLFRRLMAVRRRHPARGSSLSDRISLRGPFYRGVTPAAIASCARGLTVDVRPLALKVGTEMRFCICARVEGSRVSLSGSVSVTTSARHYNLAVTARLTKYSLRLQRHLVSPPESDRCAKRMLPLPCCSSPQHSPCTRSGACEEPRTATSASPHCRLMSWWAWTGRPQPAGQTGLGEWAQHAPRGDPFAIAHPSMS